MPELRGQIDFLRMERLNADFLSGEAQSLYDRWPQLPTDAKRNIVEEITKEIVVGGDEINIRFSYNPSLLGNAPDSPRNHRPTLAFCEMDVLVNRWVKGYPKELITLRDHIRKRRLD